MRLGTISVKRIFQLVCGAAAVSMLAICAFLFTVTGELWILRAGVLLKSLCMPQTAKQFLPASAAAFCGCMVSCRKTAVK